MGARRAVFMVDHDSRKRVAKTFDTFFFKISWEILDKHPALVRYYSEAGGVTTYRGDKN